MKKKTFKFKKIPTYKVFPDTKGPSIEYEHNFTCYLEPLPAPPFYHVIFMQWKCIRDLTPPPP